MRRSELRSTPQRRSSRKKTRLDNDDLPDDEPLETLRGRAESDDEAYSAQSSGESDTNMSDVGEADEAPPAPAPPVVEKEAEPKLSLVQTPSLMDDGAAFVFVQQAAAPAGILRGEEGTMPSLEEWGDDDLQCLLLELNEAQQSAAGRANVFRMQLQALNVQFPPSVMTNTHKGPPQKGPPQGAHAEKRAAPQPPPQTLPPPPPPPPAPAPERVMSGKTVPGAPPMPAPVAVDDQRTRKPDGRVRAAQIARDAKRKSREEDHVPMDTDGDETDLDHQDEVEEEPLRPTPVHDTIATTKKGRVRTQEKRKRREDSDASDPAFTSSDDERVGGSGGGGGSGVPKNSAPQQQTPGLFWQIVEEYFAPLTLDTLKVLEHKQIYENDPLFTLPMRGRNLAAELGEEEEPDIMDDGAPPAISLAERALCALVETRTNMPVAAGPNDVHDPTAPGFDAWRVDETGTRLEDRMRATLREAGMIPDEEITVDAYTREDDEVSAEIRKLKRKLITLSDENSKRCAGLLRNLKPLVKPHEKLKQVKEAHASLEEAYKKRQKALKARKRKPTIGTLDDVKRALQQHAGRIQAIQRGLQPAAPQPQQQRPAPSPAAGPASATRTQASPASTRLVITNAGLQSPANGTAPGTTAAANVTYSHSFVSASPQAGAVVRPQVPGGVVVPSSVTPMATPTPGAAPVPQAGPSATTPGAFQRLSGHVTIRPANPSTTVAPTPTASAVQQMSREQTQLLTRHLQMAQSQGLIQPGLVPRTGAVPMTSPGAPSTMVPAASAAVPATAPPPMIPSAAPLPPPPMTTPSQPPATSHP